MLKNWRLSFKILNLGANNRDCCLNEGTGEKCELPCGKFYWFNLNCEIKFWEIF